MSTPGSMRVLSLSQPWLWSIVDSTCPFPKRVENRSWKPPQSEVGKRFALHAAKSWDPDAIGFFLSLGIDNFPARRELYATGVLVAVATIEKVLDPAACGLLPDSADATAPLAPDQRRWFFGPIGWVLADVRPLPSPIPWKGAQGFRWLPPEIAAAIGTQLAAETISIAGTTVRPSP